MKRRKEEFEFAEIPVDRLFLESFANEHSAYHQAEFTSSRNEPLERVRKKLSWHIAHSLSDRQKQVIRFYLMGKKEREIAAILGVKQQVVHTYKHRAIRRLHELLLR
jgi:DNA-binding NarL/FixJ family response regulator